MKMGCLMQASLVGLLLVGAEAAELPTDLVAPPPDMSSLP